MTLPASNTLLLRRQLAELTKHPLQGFSAGAYPTILLQSFQLARPDSHLREGLVDESNLYEWEIMIIGPADTLYEGGFFKARLTFPPEFPDLPPKMRFTTPMWHPNIYVNGDVCISILHAPGDDQYGYEDAGERWMPVHSVESILLSVISLLSSETPNLDSPANVDAAKEVRTDFAGPYQCLFRLFLIINRHCSLQKESTPLGPQIC
ncbi:ubiquitin-conjugating enzyme [Russula emetica]|nr:ubiquitin-conjugating enzyme [Russula emetica]